MTDPDLIRAAIEASGLSARRFAERIMARDERTLRRWSAGDTNIPPIARRWLENWLELSAAARARVVKDLD
jgi:ribosome-binding protein aMBF1 (putative translation factor)